MRNAHDDGGIGSGIGVETAGRATAPPAAFGRANEAAAPHAAAIEGVPAKKCASLRRDHQLVVAQDALQRQRAKVDKRLQRLERRRCMRNLIRLDVAGEDRRAARVLSQESKLGGFGERLHLWQALPADLRRVSVRGRDDRHFEIDQRQNFGVWRRLPGRDIRRVAPLAAKTVEAGLRCELGQLNRVLAQLAITAFVKPPFQRDAPRLCSKSDWRACAWAGCFSSGSRG